MESRVTFNRETLAKLKRAYQKAIMEEKKEFTFEDHEYLVDYAKYLIEFLDQELS